MGHMKNEMYQFVLIKTSCVLSLNLKRDASHELVWNRFFVLSKCVYWSLCFKFGNVYQSVLTL